MSSNLSNIEEIIQDARNGKMFIIVDDESRENEGDLVIPAQFVTADIVNFMAKYGRGLICLSMEEARVKQLNLPLMAQSNTSRHKTAFTISIEAKEGVTTGISASDRAHTIQVAIDPSRGAEDIATPGHIFPLMAREGGVLTRAGHTEAAVDIAKLAGLNPSGVICEIMNDDGTMARMPDLVEFAKKHDLKIAKIADLISYRRQNDRLVERYYDSKINTFCGEFDIAVYRSKVEFAEHIVLSKGVIDNSKPVLVRMHSQDFLGDVLGDSSKAGNDLLRKSMQKIEENGSGIIVILRSPQKTNVSNSLKKKDGAEDAVATNQIRDYGIGAQILNDLGVVKLKLLTNSQKMVIGLEGYGIEIDSYQQL